MSPESPRSGPIRDASRVLVLAVITACVSTLSLAAPADAALPYAAKRAHIQAQASTITDRPALLNQLRRINKTRARHDLRPVRLNACLTKRVAQPYARRMASTGNFEHQQMSTLISTCPRFGWAGENIAYGYPTAKSVMQAWMNSEGHRANLLKPQYTHVGLGLTKSANGTRYWVQDFGG